MRTRARSSGWSICPSMRGDCRSRVCSLTALASGSIGEPCCWAWAGAAKATRPATATAPRMKRARANRPVMAHPPYRLVRRHAGAASFAQRSHFDPLAIGGRPAPGAGAVAALDHALLVYLGDDLTVTRKQRLGRAHLRTERQLALEHAVGAVFTVFLAAAGNFVSAAASTIGALVHLATRAEVADPGILRSTERACIEAVAAADAQILRMEYDAIIGRENAAHRADCRAGSVGTVHAGHGDRALAWLAVIDGDDSPAVDAPRHLVLVLAGGDAGVALDAPVGVAEKLHPRHGRASLRRPDLAERGLGFLHTRRRVEAVGGEGVHALAEHDRVGSLRIFAALVDALEPAGKMVWHPGHAFAHALGDQRLHPRLGVALGAGDPDPAAVLDPALGRIRRIDLDEHLLLQLGQPLVGARLLAAALVVDQPAGGQDQRELSGGALVDCRLLHAEAEIGHAELPGVRQRRIFGDEIGPRRIDHFAVDRNGIRQVPGDHTRLPIAVGYAAVINRHTLDAAREVDRPGHGVGIGGIYLSDHRHFLRCEIVVPSELLEHAERELGIPILDLGSDRIGAVGEQADAVALHAETRAERAAAFLHRQIGVVKNRGARVFEFRRSPAWPRQAVNFAADFRIVLRGAQRDHIEFGLISHMRLEPLGRLAAVAGRPAAAIDFPQDVFGRHRAVLDLDVLEHPVGEAELAGKQVHYVVVVLALEDWLDDLLAPLQRAVRSGA